MNYFGIARNSDEVKKAVALATKVFRLDRGFIEESLVVKMTILSPNGQLAPQDVVVVSDQKEEVYAACFLIDRFFYRNGTLLKGTYISSICVDVTKRGQGLSMQLMNICFIECQKRDSLFALVIARRAVDYYYNKFNFWGISQYAKASVDLSGYTIIKQYSLALATDKDIDAISRIYNAVYPWLYGASMRTTAYWKHVIWKAANENIKFSCFHHNNEVVAYAAHEGNNIYEIAAMEGLNYLDLLRQLYDGTLHLHFSEKHPVFKNLAHFDVTMSKRQCSYGGHMVKIIQADKLKRHLEQEITKKAKQLNIQEYSHAAGGISISVHLGKVAISLNGPKDSFYHTCLLMGVTTLSELPINSLLQSASFNIPIFDQV